MAWKWSSIRNGSAPTTISPSSSTAARTVAARPSTIGSPQPAMPSSVESLRNSQRGGTGEELERGDPHYAALGCASPGASR